MEYMENVYMNSNSNALSSKHLSHKDQAILTSFVSGEWKECFVQAPSKVLLKAFKCF